MRCAILLSLLAAGCTPLGWRRTEFPLQPYRSRQFEIWSHGTAARWHGVRIGWDSVSGIPYNQPLKCDSCRQSIARTAVDSICSAKPSAGNIVGTVVVLTALLVL